MEAYQTIHSDLCGPMPIDSVGGSRYFVTFLDDFSRYTHVYFIKQKNEVLQKFKEFVNLTTNLTGKQVKNLRCDNGGEYQSICFDNYLKEEGIFHQTTVPDNPSQNGIAERMNHTLVEAARSMMYHANMPQKFWAEAINTAVYLRNSSPTISLKGVTPYESLYGEKPDVSNLKFFGCAAYVHVAKQKRKKYLLDILMGLRDISCLICHLVILSGVEMSYLLNRPFMILVQKEQSLICSILMDSNLKIPLKMKH